MTTPSGTFDTNGYLVPYDAVSMNYADFVALVAWNPHRRTLLAHYEQFLSRLEPLIPVEHRQWIDGSFVSKKPEPNDVDVVIFVSSAYFNRVSNELRLLKKEVAATIDCYFVEEFPVDHPKFAVSRSDELDWYHFLRSDRRKRLKGFVNLTITYGNQ